MTIIRFKKDFLAAYHIGLRVSQNVGMALRCPGDIIIPVGMRTPSRRVLNMVRI
jgi:hypothetical protein